MRVLTVAMISWLLMGLVGTHALTVDEIIKLKQAGLSDATIQMRIDRDGTAKAAGTWKTKDGWFVHTTETREPPYVYLEYQPAYPILVYPRVFVGRH